MKTENYNLIEEEWIPVLMKDGSYRRVSLGEIFSHGDRIADLSMIVYERISIMRLLICIAMAALDEADLADETAWRASRGKIPDAVAAYFAKWHDRFNFYGPHAFMQPDGLTVGESGKTAKIDKIVIDYSSGNGGTLFDHAGAVDDREVFDYKRVLAMLSYQNFSAGGQHPKCIWCGVETSASVTAGPLREKNMLHTFVNGENLIETIWLNILTSEMIATLPTAVRGRPIWELDSLDRTTLARVLPECTVFGRLVPLARVMKFIPHSQSIPLGNGLKYEGIPAARVFEAAVRMKKGTNDTEEFSYVPTSPEEAPWRNLQSVLSHMERRGAMSLRHVSVESCEMVSIWSGGLVTDGKAKDVSAQEWRFTLPVSLLEDCRLAVYRHAVEIAKACSDGNLKTAAKTYCEEMKLAGPATVLSMARRFYWDALEKEQPKLVRIVCEDGDIGEWDRIVATTARKAFDQACPHQTGRQIAAYAKALCKLSFKKKEHEKK